MRTKIPPGGRNYAQVVLYDYSGGSAPVCHNTDAALGEKKAKRFEAVALITDKYQALNGTSPAFFREPERYKGTN